jgi:hypothetical protein
MSMSKALLTSLSAAVLLSAVLGTRAVAMPLAVPAPGIANARAALVERVTNVCGINGCTPVYTKRIVRPKRTGTLIARPIIVQQSPNLLQSLGFGR